MVFKQQIAQLLISNHLSFTLSCFGLYNAINSGKLYTKKYKYSYFCGKCACVDLKSRYYQLKLLSMLKNINQLQLFFIINDILSFMTDRRLDDVVYACSATVVTTSLLYSVSVVQRK
jgi:hypothetical protein